MFQLIIRFSNRLLDNENRGFSSALVTLTDGLLGCPSFAMFHAAVCLPTPVSSLLPTVVDRTYSSSIDVADTFNRR